MWAVNKAKFTGFLNRFFKSTHLTAQRILNLYSYLLFFIPIAFVVLLQFRSTATKVSIPEMIMKSPLISISVIIAFADFILGYYLWISKNKVLQGRKSYRFFMICQAISQILVGNLVCFVMCLLGLYQAKTVTTKKSKNDKMMNSISIGMLLLFIICFTFLTLLQFRKA